MAKTKTNQSKGTRGTSGATSNVATLTWPEVPPGYKSIPLEPVWFDDARLDGVFVDVEQTEDENGNAVRATVFITTAPVQGRTNDGRIVNVGTNQVVRIKSALFLKLAPAAADPEQAYPCIVHRQRDAKGRVRYAFYMRDEPIPRSSITIAPASTSLAAPAPAA